MQLGQDVILRKGLDLIAEYHAGKETIRIEPRNYVVWKEYDTLFFADIYTGYGTRYGFRVNSILLLV